MLNAALVFAFACIGLALLLNLVRLVRGPDPADRILALDTMYINTIALLIALMGFISTVALCKYLLRGDIIE